jgi:hypothetical protein
MLTLMERAEQERVDGANAFGHRLAELTKDDVVRSLRTRPRQPGPVRPLSRLLPTPPDEALAASSRWRGHSEASSKTAIWEMHRVAAPAGDGRLPEWGVGADPWMALQPAVEVHALSVALDDLLTNAQHQAARIPGL